MVYLSFSFRRAGILAFRQISKLLELQGRVLISIRGAPFREPKPHFGVPMVTPRALHEIARGSKIPHHDAP